MAKVTRSQFLSPTATPANRILPLCYLINPVNSLYEDGNDQFDTEILSKNYKQNCPVHANSTTPEVFETFLVLIWLALTLTLPIRAN